MDRVASQITCRHQEVATQLPLDRQIPVLHLSRIDIAQHCEISIRDERSLRIVTSRKWIAAGDSRPRIAEARIDEVRARSPRRNYRRPEMILRVGIFITQSDR